MDEIKRLQEHLLLIRRTVGWTAEEFGDRIGVTRQTINNFESGRNKMTKTQYIAIRSILDAEIKRVPEDTEMLRVLLDVLVDHPEKYSKETRTELLNKANMMAPSILAGTTTRANVSKEWMKSANAIATFGTLLSAAIGTWLGIIMTSNLKDKKE